MKHTTTLIVLALALGLAALVPAPARAQSTSCTSANVTENFTGATTNCTWNWIGGACLTAAASGSTTSPGPLPQCVGSTYYGSQRQYGGNSDNLNNTPDTPASGGALRLTNDATSQAGAIISTQPFSLSANGVQISFTTETYEGDSGGTNSDGADGISFFLQDASVPTVTLGDWGGSLGYTCSNTNNSASQGYDGMVGGYIGLGIDEFGNFLNGTTITNSDGTTSSSTGADNTSSGYGYVPNRIGLRGAGSTAWSWLNTNAATKAYYPSTLTSGQKTAAVRQACQTGYVWDYRNANTSGNGGNTNNFPNPYGATAVSPRITLANYAAIPNAYKVLTAHKIANELAHYRGYGTTATSSTSYGVPITYNLSITTSGLLSLSYSYNNGNFSPIITGQDITAANGSLPASVRFGFAGSTGGSKNIHEIMCFQAQPQNSASSSAGLNQKQTAKVQTGTQVYFAFYNPNNWTGDLTSQYLDSPDGNPNDLQIDPAVNWSAACNLTGVPTGGTCAKTGVAGYKAAANPDSGRTILSWNGSAGIAFKYANLSSSSSNNQQANMDFGDLAPNSSPTATNAGPPADARVEYLRGIRSDEQTAQGYGPYTPATNPSGFRARTSVLGDIVDSSPTWVGPPAVSFPTVWKDYLYASSTMAENAGTSYSSFESTYQTRTNVVYAGANDGLLHGFRSGHFSTYSGATGSGTFVGTDNDGAEVLAYMPGYVVNTINSSALANTQTPTPNPVNDYTNPLYAHKFNVDGTPGTGDLFYNGRWHTWLVGGLGAGGSAIYALDITDPSLFSESTPGGVVIGEWQSALTTTTATSNGVTTTSVTGATANFSCAGNPASSTCGNSLGKTFGTPQIRRFHNVPASGGTSWGVVFGNGSGSFNGDAGIFVMLVNTTSTGVAAPTFYYLSTGVGSNYTTSSNGTVTQTGNPAGSNSNGIYYVSPADLDGDHVTDFVYAGDLQGNIWRFDLTDTNPANWAVTKNGGVPTPIYTTLGGKSQPITTQVIVASVASSPSPRILVEFGTGQQTPFTNNSASTYSTSQQYLIGVWDWNMTTWNAASTLQFASLASGTATVSGLSQLKAQTFLTYDATGTASSQSSTSATDGYYRTVTNGTICWAGTTGCTGSGAQYGWAVGLASGYANINDPSFPTTATSINAQQVFEQVIFNPTLQLGAFIVNTTIPPTTNLATCTSTLPGGWTMAIDPATGGAFTNSVFANANHNFLNIGSQAVSGIALSGTGSPSIVTAGTNTYVVTQTTNGSGTIQQTNLPGINGGKRVTWIQKR